MTSDDLIREKAALLDEIAADLRPSQHNLGLQEALSHYAGRILATQKPKRWPLHLPECHLTASVAHSGNLHLEAPDDAIWLKAESMDRLCVAWLEERGVDLARLVRLGRFTHADAPLKLDCCEECDLAMIAIKIDAILDAAEEQA